MYEFIRYGFSYSTISLAHLKKILIVSTKADDGDIMSPWYANGTMNVSLYWKPLQSQFVFEESWFSTSSTSLFIYAQGSTGYYTPKPSSNIGGPNHFRIQRPVLHERKEYYVH